MYLGNKITYIGVDETSIGTPGNLIIVGAKTTDSALAIDRGQRLIRKARDFYADGLPLPTLDEIFSRGVEEFDWIEERGGRFKRQVIQHASIGHLVLRGDSKPGRTVILIDGFYGGNGDRTKGILADYLGRHGYPIPEGNIKVVNGGDQSVPIINYADLVAFQVGFALHEEHRRRDPSARKFEVMSPPLTREAYMGRRVEPIGSLQQDTLERVMVANYGNKYKRAVNQ